MNSRSSGKSGTFLVDEAETGLFFGHQVCHEKVPVPRFRSKEKTNHLHAVSRSPRTASTWASSARTGAGQILTDGVDDVFAHGNENDRTFVLIAKILDEIE